MSSAPQKMSVCTEHGRVERGVVTSLWHNLNGLLMNGSANAQVSIGLMQDGLPSMDALDTRELAELAKLHMSSASSLMQTLRLMVPRSVLEDCADPDKPSLLVDALGGALLDLVATLTDLQLFHLHRAAALVAHAKKRLRSSCEPQTL